jgi:hypothetical protein
VPAHTIHLRDRRPAGQQGIVERLLLGQRDAIGWQWQQGRAATGDQADNQVILRKSADQFEHPFRGHIPRLVRNRMCRFDDLDALAGHAVAVPGDDQSFQPLRPVLLEHPCHRRGSLPRADDDGAALRRRRKMQRNEVRRLRGLDSRIEHCAQQLPGRFSLMLFHYES